MKNKVWILFFVCQTICFSTMAQEHLKIKNIFDKYGQQKGSVLVQLSTDILTEGNKITFYKSLIMDEDDKKAQDVIQAIAADIIKGEKISEVRRNGKIEMGTYLLKSDKSTNEYILYKNKSKKITIVYLKGNFSPNQLDAELNKLKDLFIYVNDKRIKLQ